jgi:hypothetical protein
MDSEDAPCREERTLALPALTPALNVGFLTVAREGPAYVGGYLVTNQWGRPLEFRLSTAVQPNRVQQILYADTLEPYICGDLIGKTLVEKTGIGVQVVVTDTPAALDLRNRIETPVVLLGHGGEVPSGHPRYPDDAAAIETLLRQLRGVLDLVEPFGRIREAMAEARKMGVTKSA